MAAMRHCTVYILNGILTFTSLDVCKFLERVKERRRLLKIAFYQGKLCFYKKNQYNPFKRYSSSCDFVCFPTQKYWGSFLTHFSLIKSVVLPNGFLFE